MKRWLYLKAVSTIARAIGLTDPRLLQHFGGGPTFAGETVTIEASMRIETVWACVRLIASTIATLPLEVFQRLPDGRGQLVRNHQLWSLLHDQPNADMTAVVFWQAMVASLLLWGNGYAYIDRRNDGTVISLTPLIPAYLSPELRPDGSILYHYSFQGTRQDYTEDQVFHVKGFSVDGLIGMSPVAQGRESLGIAVAAEKSAASFFRNGMRPSMVMKAPMYLSENQRERFGEAFVDKFAGSMATGRIPILEGGWTLDQITMKPEDAQLLATRAYSVEQICRWFGVAPAMVGHMDKSTAWGTGLEQMNLWFLTYTLRPWLRTIEQEISRSIMTPAQRIGYYAEFNVEGLLRADSEKRSNTLKTLVTSSILTPNEARQTWDTSLAPLDNGDDLLTAAGTSTLENISQPPPPPQLDPGRQQDPFSRQQTQQQGTS
jgi:HK97 family phage portal protein